MAVVRQNLQHGQAFAQPTFVGFGQPTQFLQQAHHHRLWVLVAEVAQDRQYQGIGLVAGVQGALER